MSSLRLSGQTYQAIASQAGISRQRVQQLLSPPKVIRDIVIHKYDGKCALCGVEVGVSGNVHHEEGNGEDNYQEINNLLLLCVSCHILKHNKTPNVDVRAKRATSRVRNKDINIREALDKLDLERGELAEILGVGIDTVGRWIRGDQRPRVAHLRKIKELLEKGKLPLGARFKA